MKKQTWTPETTVPDYGRTAREVCPNPGLIPSRRCVEPV